MKDMIRTNLESCVGCNRCVRECPMELANIVYQDESDAIKVKSDHTKCINCGRCVYVCKNGARVYSDDTERLFDDLNAGVPISLIAAPSLQTNIPEYKRLFTYLKKRGVNRIYDVSFGTDICAWANIRYMLEAKTERKPIITQTCPVVVSYIEVYKPELLNYISPIHSPLACVSVYMKKYEGITDRIAAVSPCIAKSDEFEETMLAQYNVTFAKLKEYMVRNSISLPEEETDFDCHARGLGSVFPEPGGLTENIELHFGKNVHVLKGEGSDIFDKLDSYAAADEDALPDIFDVRSCEGGCNIGSAGLREGNIFTISRVMKRKLKHFMENCGKEYLDRLYREFDNHFNLIDFMRDYRSIRAAHPHITCMDIEKAYRSIGKNSYQKQSLDCGACGSDTCYSMARKIALGVNIPINCIVKAMEDVRDKHEKNLLAHKQLQDTHARLESALERADAASKAKGDFLSTMSHEMRTPMHAIIGMTAIGKKAEDIDGKNKALNKIGDASSHLLGVINDVLDMAKIEANKLELACVKYNFEKMVQKVINVINYRVDEKRQKLSVNIDNSIPRFVIGDDHHLAQVIANLLSNAVKFTPEGGNIALNVFLSDETDSGIELRIEVTDSGIGISPDQQEKLFVAFKQAENGTSREYGGTGLGLVISKKIVELMDGRIWVESELGKGAKFVFTVKAQRSTEETGSLPYGELLDAENDDTGAAGAHNGTELIDGEFADKRMLLAEDVEINREIIVTLLENTGLKIDSAENGKEAYEMIKAEPDRYDVVFMDVQMPKMDGYESTRRIRELNTPQSVRLPIIAMTANVFRSDIEACLDAGMDDHLGKPLDIDRVLETLRKHLGSKSIGQKQRR